VNWDPNKTVDQIVGSIRRFNLKKKDITKLSLLPPDEVKKLIAKNGFDPEKINKLLVKEKGTLEDTSFLD